MISHYLQKMMCAAEREGHQELEKNAALEEEIFFPTVLLIADYHKQKSIKDREKLFSPSTSNHMGSVGFASQA